MTETIAVPTATQENEIGPKENRLALVSSTLTRNDRALAALLGNFMPADRFRAMVVTQCKANPDLQKCTVGSIMVAAMRIAQLRLSPDPALGQAWLIPRKGRAEFQLGWKGCLALAYRSPLVGAVRYGVVRAGEAFEWRDGRDWRLEHVPGADGWPTSPGETAAAWAIIELTTGFAVPRVMFTPEILRHKGRGSGSQPAWTSDFAAMAVKTVLGDACRRAPLGDDAARALNIDNAGEVGLGQPAEEAIEVEFSSVPEPGDGAASKAEAFKAAFSQPAAESEHRGDAITYGMAGREPGEDDNLGDALDERGVNAFAPGSHIHRIGMAAAARGIAVADIDGIIGGPLHDLPADLETEALLKLSVYKAAR